MWIVKTFFFVFVQASRKDASIAKVLVVGNVNTGTVLVLRQHSRPVVDDPPLDRM